MLCIFNPVMKDKYLFISVFSCQFVQLYPNRNSSLRWKKKKKLSSICKWFCCNKAATLHLRWCSRSKLCRLVWWEPHWWLWRSSNWISSVAKRCWMGLVTLFELGLVAGKNKAARLSGCDVSLELQAGWRRAQLCYCNVKRHTAIW